MGAGNIRDHVENRLNCDRWKFAPSAVKFTKVDDSDSSSISMSGRTARSWITEKPFVHRGLLTGNFPENSLEAFAECIASGHPIELDVQLTGDARALVFHDATLDRLTGLTGRVAGRSLGQLQKVRFCDTPITLPSLQDVLDLVAGREGILIELKNRGPAGALEHHVATLLSTYTGKTAVQSFNPWTVGWFRKHAPRVLRGQLSCIFDTDPMAEWKKFVLSNYGMNWFTGPHFVGHQWQHLPSMATRFLRYFHRIPLLAWTITSPEQARLIRAHADNFIAEKSFFRG